MSEVSIGEIALVIAAAAFVILTVFLIRFLLTLKETLGKTNHLIDGLNLTNQDIRVKMRDLDPWFEMTGEVGINLARCRDKYHTWRSHRVTYSTTSKTTSVVADVLECALAALRVWDQSQPGR